MPAELTPGLPGYRPKIPVRPLLWSLFAGSIVAFCGYGTWRIEIPYNQKREECEAHTTEELAMRQRERARRCLELPKEASAIMTACMTMVNGNAQQKCVAIPDPPIPDNLKDQPCTEISPMRYTCAPASF